MSLAFVSMKDEGVLVVKNRSMRLIQAFLQKGSGKESFVFSLIKQAKM